MTPKCLHEHAKAFIDHYLRAFRFVICLWCLPYQLNRAWDAIKSFDLHLAHHTITTLIVST
jgi:hypothetical protein